MDVVKNQWRLIAGIVLILIILIFAVMNVEAVPVNFGFAVVNGPLIIVIFVSLLMGSLITLLVATASTTSNRKEMKEIRQKLSRQDEEVEKAVSQAKGTYEAQIASLQETITQQNNKIKSLEDELVQQMTSPKNYSSERSGEDQAFH